MTVEVTVLGQVTDEVVKAFGRLLPQLSTSAPPLDARSLDALVAQPAVTVLLARLDGDIVGTLTLVLFAIPTGLRAWIEDVVVDGEARGGGIGAALTEEAVRLAEVAGARPVAPPPRPPRQAANRLYERLGFVARDSRVLRHSAAD